MVARTTSLFSIGDIVRLTVTVTASSNATPTDSDVTYMYKTPSGVVQSWATTASTLGGNNITRVSTGVYRFDFQTTEKGNYAWSFRSTGTVTATTGGTVAVRPSWVTT